MRIKDDLETRTGVPAPLSSRRQFMRMATAPVVPESYQLRGWH